jgi:hypothetical protein
MRWWLDKIKRKIKLIQTMPPEKAQEIAFYVFIVAVFLFMYLSRRY